MQFDFYIDCTSQNTETVIKTFWQPSASAVFFSEQLPKHLNYSCQVFWLCNRLVNMSVYLATQVYIRRYCSSSFNYVSCWTLLNVV